MTDVAEWERAAAAVLRKGGRLTADDPDHAVWDKLTRRTLDQIPVRPLGVPGDQPVLPPLPHRTDAAWDVRVQTRGGDEALAALETGANSLWVRPPVGAAEKWYADALAGVLLDLAPVVLDGADADAARHFLDWLGAQDTATAAGTGLGLDPLGDWLRGHLAGLTSATPQLAGALDLAAPALAQGVTPITVDGTAVHDHGASDAWEIAVTLAAGAAYLRALTGTGLSDEQAFAALEFRYAVTDEQFPSIAKLRAARRCWARIAELSWVAAPAQRQHAITSRPMTTRYDPWVNLLRTTVAAFAAGVGGADALTVLPYDAALGEPDADARRWARNISALLISESHAGVVTDPAAGSSTVEELTSNLAEQAWTHFTAIEAAGGITEAAGLIAEAVADARDRRAALVATRRLPITGVSEFPLLGEALPIRPAADGWPQVASYAAAYEALRDDPATRPVFLATMGSVAAHTARATFAANLFAAGGVATDQAGATQTPADLVASYRGQSVVCLAGSDAAYAEWGAAAGAALREAGASRVILAGKPGPSTIADDLVDDSCALGNDALAFLARTRAHLAAAPADSTEDAS